ncbi:hypothetical protein SAMN06298216_3561 [Spirosomataceae bacterium TFI 002]|nr:hypothetical protein SAMN06298216_3561 [Spirosomataceae bacterium TFI 002]
MIEYTCNPFLKSDNSFTQLETKYEERPQATQQLYPSNYYQSKPYYTDSTPSTGSKSTYFWLWLLIFLFGGFLIYWLWPLVKSKLMELEASNENVGDENTNSYLD